jgi:hypothetical protein
VTALQSCPDLVTAIGGNTSNIRAFMEGLAIDSNLRLAVLQMPPGSILIAWNGTTPRRLSGGALHFAHRFSLYLRAPEQESTATYADLFWLVVSAKPTGAQSWQSLAMTTKYNALYLQDNYKVTSRLALNLGIRWEYETPKTHRFNQFDNFNYSAVPPITAPALNLHGALSFVGVNGVSRYQSNPSPWNFAPRIGFAYRLGDKTVIRGGGGLFYADNWGIGTGSTGFGSSGFFTTVSIVTSLDGATPIVSLSNPFPTGLIAPTGNKLGPATLLGQAVDFTDRGISNPYAGSWHISVQRDLGKSMILEVGYTGSRGVKFPFSVQLNELPDPDLKRGNQLRTLVPNPFYPQIASGALASSTVAEAQLLLPYPQFGQVTSDNADIANSSYNALEVKFQKRYSHGLTVMGAYTYSKLIDLNIGSFSGDTTSAGVISTRFLI